MNFWLIVIIINVFVLWLCLLFVVLIRIRFKMFEKRMIENTKELLTKIESSESEDGKKMDKDLVNAVKFLTKKIKESEENILERFDEMVVNDEDLEEEDLVNDDDELENGLSEDDNDDNEDVFESDDDDDDQKEYSGKRQVTTEAPAPPKEKKGLFGRKKGRPKKEK